MSVIVIAALFRSADLTATYLISPNLKHEINPIVRMMGWKWTIVANVAACVLCMTSRPFFYGVIFFSFCAIVWNLRILFKKIS